MAFSLCIPNINFPFFKDIRLTGLGLCVNLKNYMYRYSVSKQAHFLRHWELRLEHKNLWGAKFHPDYLLVKKWSLSSCYII